MYVKSVTLYGGWVAPPLTLTHDLLTETPFDTKYASSACSLALPVCS
jgi:hypothetical protein